MGINLVLIHLIAVSFAIYTITVNDAYAFSIPEEMDYSVPFDFLSSSEDETMEFDKPLDPSKSIAPETEDTYFAGQVDTDIFIERENTLVKNSDENHSPYEKDLNNENILNEISDSESSDIKNKSNSHLDAYENKYAEKIDELKSENVEKSSKITTNDRKMVIINFDDNWKTQFENAKSILDEYQFKSTFYVVCDYVGGKNRLTWQQIQSLYDEGHEIGSHTTNHENLDQITQDARYHEIVE